MADEILLTLNAGSSTVKFGVFSLEPAGPRRIGKGMIDFQQHPLTFHLTDGPALFDVALKAKPDGDLHAVMDEIFGWLAQHFDMSKVAGVGHRVVHGGDIFSGPVLIDPSITAAIESLVPLAPLHQPQSLRLIRAVAHLRPNLLQTASFDTSFHATNDDLVRRFALPRALHEQGIKRYGFHGLSYSFIARELKRVAPGVAGKRVIVAHLGSGCSLCGLTDGVSRDTSMGFSTLDGVPMATRCGALDPGVLLHYLLADQKQSSMDLEDLLYHRSGLLGVSGISGDSRELLASDRPEAKQALDLFAFRIAGEAARIANTLGGLDAFVFTAGIGEHQPEIRAAIAGHLHWMGLELDQCANAKSVQTISATSSRVTALVLSTDEEQVIANDAWKIAADGRVAKGAQIKPDKSD
jgi:acetate kinase